MGSCGRVVCWLALFVGGVMASCEESTEEPWQGLTTARLDTVAEMSEALFGNPSAAEICIAQQACRMLEPGDDDNEAFPFAMCMIYNNVDCANRRNRLDCERTWKGDCAGLENCLSSYLTVDLLEQSCKKGVWRLLSASGEQQYAIDCRILVYHGVCLEQGAGCTYSDADVSRGDSGPADRCEGNTLVRSVNHVDGVEGAAVRIPCGTGFHCAEHVYPQSNNGKCVADGWDYWPTMGLACNGKKLHFVAENGFGMDYDCESMGYRDCQDGRCVW